MSMLITIRFNIRGDKCCNPNNQNNQTTSNLIWSN